MTQQELELPKGWVETTLGDSDISEIIMGQSPPGSTYNKEKNGMPFFQGIKDFGEKFPIATVWCTRPKKIAKKGDILLSVRAPVGTTNWAKEECCIGRGLVAIRPKIQSEYVYCFLKSIQIKLSGSGVGSVFNAISKGELCQISLPVPPLNEQKRIVSKIEELFSKIDSTKQSLEHAKLQLVQYRHSLLKSAFESKLTEKWRQKNENKIENVSILLEKINRKKSFKHKPIEESLIKPLYAIPKTWKWIQFSILINKIKRGPSLKCNTEGKGIRYITSGNLEDGKLQLDLDYKFLEKFDNIDTCKLVSNDLILNCVNSIEKIGKSAIYKNEQDAIIGFNNYAIELDSNVILPDLCNYFFQSIFAKKQIYFLIKRAVNQVSFATNELDRILFSFPPLEEQEQIVYQIEQGFSLTENSQRIVNSTLQTLETMRMSVLKQAFEGKLVPQDPNDEPASILLEKIKNAQVDLKPKQGRAKNVK